MSAHDLHIVQPGTTVCLDEIDPSKTPGLSGSKDHEKAQAMRDLAENVEAMKLLQRRLYAESKQSLLIVLQGMDCGGKDGTIRHVLGPLNPQGIHVASFKKPTDEELAHDFLWRIHKQTPALGEIGVFNRSHYEDVLVVRVMNLVPEERWRPRYDHINEFERTLADSGSRILKFMLHISKEEQKERLEARLDDPDKAWKFNMGDLDSRRKWGDYVRAYEDVLAQCSTDHAPWYVIPADRKWYRNWAISEIVRRELESMDPRPPAKAKELEGVTVE